jgi:hypothetical protein
MSERNRSVILRPNTLMPSQASPLAFEKKPASSVQGIPKHLRPLRLPLSRHRECDDWTFGQRCGPRGDA